MRRKLTKEERWCECRVCGRRANLKRDPKKPHFCKLHQVEEKAWIKEQEDSKNALPPKDLDIIDGWALAKAKQDATERRAACKTCEGTGTVDGTDEADNVVVQPCPDCYNVILDGDIEKTDDN